MYYAFNKKCIKYISIVWFAAVEKCLNFNIKDYFDRIEMRPGRNYLSNYDLHGIFATESPRSNSNNRLEFAKTTVLKINAQ